MASKFLGVALVMAALLCACGGGGSAVPPTVTPTTAPTPVSTAAAVSIPVGAVPTTAALGTIAGQTASLTVPVAASGSGSVNAQLLATQPSVTPTLQSSKRLPRAIGTSQLTPLLFVAFMPTVAFTFSSTPAFTFTFPAGFSLASGTQPYIALYDPTQPAAGWQNFLGPGTVTGSSSTGITIAFASIANAVSFQANQTYIFALFTTGAIITVPTPTPSPIPTPTPTAFPGGATIVATFITNAPAAARSATFTFGGTGGSPQTVALPANCSSPTCSVSVSAPIGSNSVQVLLYATTTGLGTPLAYGTATVTALQNQSTAVNVSLTGVMSTFTISLSPATVTPGQGTPITINYNPVDAAGDNLAPGSFASSASPGPRTTPVPNFVTTTLVQPTISVTIADPAGAVTLGTAGVSGLGLAYLGAGSGPATITVQAVVITCSGTFNTTCVTANFGSASATLNYPTVNLTSIGYATSVSGADTLAIHAPLGSSIFPRTLYNGGSGAIAFDPSGTLWFPSAGPSSTVMGVNSNGSAVGAFTLSGNLLAFDLSGNAYALGSYTAFAPCLTGFVDSSTVNVYGIAGGSPNLTRTITAASAVNSVAPGPGGTLYVGTASGVYQYGSTGNGTITPIASNTNAAGPVATDTQGNVYAIYSGALAKWTSGTFGLAPPTTTYTATGLGSSQSPLSVAIDTIGNVFLSYAGYTGGNASTLVVYPSGSTTPTILQTGTALCTWVATPLK